MDIKQTRNYSLDYLRVLAMMLVVLDHLAFMRNQNWFVFKLIDKSLFQPLGIIQYGGALGVSIFYIMSGFFFVNSIQNAKSSGSFILKKLISLWIPCVAAFVLFFIFQKIIGIITPAGRYWWQFSAKDWILSGSLVATFVGSYDKINVTWFLIPLIIFFVYNAFVWNLSYSSKVKLFICWGIVITMYVIGKYIAENKFFFTLGDRAWFITLIISGVIFGLVKNKDFSKKEGIIFLSINYILTIIGMFLYSPGYIKCEKYLVSFVYAILMFVAFSKIELKENRIISFLSKISFTVNLTHMTFGSLTTGLFERFFPFAIAVLIGISVSFLTAIILHYSVEVPLKNLIAKIKI